YADYASVPASGIPPCRRAGLDRYGTLRHYRASSRRHYRGRYHSAPAKAACPPPGNAPPPVCINRPPPASLAAGGAPMIAFVNVFSQITGKTVVDRTGLTGLFEADLQWTPDAPPVTSALPVAPETAHAYDPNGPSFTTAIREQLGLRLESRTDS